ncbi:MAG: YicC/YloC family endoribonuclease [Thermodesulfobacteriota bacterium]|nr:YicC/YloC family endoribonuclease [Thermodesulfobacteriota bacterium]
MTGFGVADKNGFHIEIKGVNSRYREIRMRLPSELSSLEIPLKNMVHGSIERGKADIFVSYIPSSSANNALCVDMEYAQVCYDELTMLADKFGGEVCFRDLLTLPGITGRPIPDAGTGQAMVEEPLKAALEGFIESRRIEGETLCADITPRVERLLEIREEIDGLSKGMADIYRQRLQTRLDTLIHNDPSVLDKMIDENRLAQESLIMADKSDITEELVRLETHLGSFKDTMETTKAMGRRLDFILQEINREINTIGSKAQITNISSLVIDAKSELEKIREQVQNIE